MADHVTGRGERTDGAIATRFDKRATRYRAGLHIASLILWLRQPAQERLPDTA